MSTKTALIILDGWGIGNLDHSNAIYKANTPFYDFIESAYPSTTIFTHGRNVGLPEGQMGNSEVGHMNLGAGRVVWQMLEKINIDFEQQKFAQFPKFLEMIEKAKQKNKLHICGLLSNGGVHSHIKHAIEICKLATAAGIENIYLHAFLDGRDTDPKSGKGFIKEFIDNVPKNVKIATIIGRYYAMDRDKRWERTAKAYKLITNLTGIETDNPLKLIDEYYAKNITDEFMEPIVCEPNSKAAVEPDDTILFFNFRTDRGRQLTQALSQNDFDSFDMKKIPLHYYTMTVFDDTYRINGTMYPKEDIQMPIGEVISKNGKSQLRAAETEKYPHVTFFFNGGKEEPFPNEKRLMVNSPKVATYDLKPEMSAEELTEKAKEIIKQEQPDFVCLNYANPDMVGHTGVFDSIVKAIETLDTCLKQLCEILSFYHYNILVTADHGNAEFAINTDGTPNTAHTTNPVRLILFDKSYKLKPGILANIAPTILELMQIDKPKEMEEDSLLIKNTYNGVF